MFQLLFRNNSQKNKYGKKDNYFNNNQPYQRQTVVKEPEPTPNISINANAKDDAGFTRQTLPTSSESSNKMSIGNFARRNLDVENVIKFFLF